MPRRCLVYGCRFAANMTPDGTVHSFPTQDATKKLWRVVSGRALTDSQIANGGVCCHHFSQKHYKEANVEERRILVEGAYPDINLPDIYSGDVTFTAADVRDILDLCHSKNRVIANLAHQKASSSRRIQELECRLTQCTDELKANQLMQKDASKEFRAQVHGVFSKIFTRNQIDLMLDGNDFKQWNDEDKSKAIAIYNCSKACYQFLCDNGHPLPSMTSIRRWMAKIDIVPGIIRPVISLLKDEFASFTPMQRQAMLCFDECAIDSRVSLVGKNQRILGPHKTVMAVFVRGLFYPWKQLVYFGFDDRITNQSICNIVSALHESGVNVVGLVSDMGTINIRVWNELGINPRIDAGGPYSFPHPVHSEPIWVFADFCHMIKLLRNHFLDHEIKLGEDFNHAVVGISTVKKLINAQRHDLQVQFKLTERHLVMNSRQRMNVRTAFELFSETTAKAIVFLFPDNSKDRACADFILLVNNFCDLMNSRRAERNVNPYKCPLGMEIDTQMELINNFHKVICELRVVGGGRQIVKPFQKGFHLLIESMKGLLQQMKSAPVSCEYIQTSHCNQDFVESGFSSFRGIGGFNDSPLPADCITRFKAMILSWSIRTPNTGNVHKENNTEFFSSKRYGALSRGIPDTAIPVPATCAYLADKFKHIDPNAPPQITRLNVDPTVKSKMGGIEYVAGSIAKRLFEDHPQLTAADGVNQINWVRHLSHGFLTSPSRSWVLIFLKFEQYFDAYHKADCGSEWNLNRGCLVINNLADYLMHVFPTVPKKVISFYVTLRTKIRINAINQKIVQIRRKRRAQTFVDSFAPTPVNEETLRTLEEEFLQDYGPVIADNTEQITEDEEGEVALGEEDLVEDEEEWELLSV